MKKFILLLVLCMFMGPQFSAQTQIKYFSAITTIDNPIYGPPVQLFNPSGAVTLHLDKIVVSVDPSISVTNQRNLEFAIVFVAGEQGGYVQQGILPVDLATAGSNSVARFSIQPCGFPCTPSYANFAAAAVQRIYLNKNKPTYIETFTRAGSGDIPPGKGVAIFTWQQDPTTGNYLGWQGDLSVSIQYHE